jgi:hypothetical protein
MSYITISDRGDGFGAQLQHILFGMMYAKRHGLTYVHKPINSMEHNYDNKSIFIEEIEEYLNIRNNYITLYDKPDVPDVYFWTLYNYVAVNFEECLPTLAHYKTIFWSNKTRAYDRDKMHIAVHVRRPNPHDNRIEGADTPDSYFLERMEQVRREYPGEKQFHVYSQGTIDTFSYYLQEDVQLHLNEDIRDSFLGMVSADILIASNSAFSYTASLLTEGIVYCIRPKDKKPMMDDLAPLAQKWILC